MTLLCTLLAIAAPSLMKFGKAVQLKDSARDLIAVSKLAREIAMSKSITLTLWTNQIEHTYGITSLESDDSNPLVSFTYSLPQQQEISSITASDTFIIATYFPDGSFESSIQQLQLSQPQSDTIQLDWDPLQLCLRLDVFKDSI